MSEEGRIEWNVLRTRSRQENVVAGNLVQKQIEVYLPNLPRLIGKKPREAPIFPGYVFVKPRPEQVYALNFIPGSCGLLLLNGRPGTVRERELVSIRRLVDSNVPFDMHLGLLPGPKVRVIRGPLAGVEGELVGVRNARRLVINAEILGRSVSVEINAMEIATL